MRFFNTLLGLIANSRRRVGIGSRNRNSRSIHPRLEALEERTLLSLVPTLLANINPTGDANPHDFVAFNNSVYFVANDGGLNGAQLWKTDGTTTGTKAVTSIAGLNPTDLTVVGNMLYFAGSGGFEALWKSDGSNTGTEAVKTFTSACYDLQNVNGTVVFINYDGEGLSNTDGLPWLWRSNGDGSSSGTYPLDTIGENAGAPLVVVNKTLFYTLGTLQNQDDPSTGTGYPLTISDGTQLGTTPLRTLKGFGVSDPTNVNGTLYFFAGGGLFNGALDTGLFETDGSVQGTTFLKQLNSEASSAPYEPTASGSASLYFMANAGLNPDNTVKDEGLWKSDGTVNGTGPIWQHQGSNISWLTDVNGTVYFDVGTELYQTDGTQTGTSPGASSAGNLEPIDLTNLNGTLFYASASNKDGLRSTTPSASSITAYPVSSAQNLTNINGTLFFSGAYGSGFEPYVVRTVNNLAISAPASAQAGTPVPVTVTVQDGQGNTVTGFTGTVQLTSSDGQAIYNAKGLPASYTFTPGDSGTHTFQITLFSAGTQSITVSDQLDVTQGTQSATIQVEPADPSKLVVNPSAGAEAAGAPFLVTVQAEDNYGNPVTNFNGPVTFLTTDPKVPTLPGTAITNGFGVTLGTFETAGQWTIFASSPTSLIRTGVASLSVTPGSAVYFNVDTPQTAVTNTTFPITVTALDAFGNLATTYTGTVHLSSTDNAAVAAGDLGGNYTFTTGAGQDNGVHVFNVQLLTEGNQKITVADTTATIPAIIGTSSAIAASGLTVTALTKTPTGFTASFNQAINPADLTLYGNGTTVQDVLLVGANTNNAQPYPGTLIVDASKKLITFNVSSNFLAASNPGGSAALPDDTYTVTLVSGVGNNGFQDVSGQGLDDGQGGHADFVGTFTTTYQADKTEVLGIPDFARGPNASGDISTLIKVPNDPANGGHIGIPITIYNASNLISIGFTLTYNANILTVTGGIIDPANARATFQMTSNVMSADGVHSVATFEFSNDITRDGTQVLGDITAYVPYSARSQYQVKDLLALGNITVSGGAAVVPGDAVDVNAYFGAVDGTHTITGLDKSLIDAVAKGINSGFPAFRLLDPAIIGDLANDNSVTANSTSLMIKYLKPVPVAGIPTPPGIPENQFSAPDSADPTLSLPASVSAARGVANLPIYLDHARPAGSTGLVEAELTLKYDPAALSVSAADITMGSLPSQGTGWQLSASINAATGTISIQLYSQTPITTDEAGSLVNIAFHVEAGANSDHATTVQLVDSKTVLADDQAAMILSPGLDWTAVFANA